MGMEPPMLGDEGQNGITARPAIPTTNRGVPTQAGEREGAQPSNMGGLDTRVP